MTEQLAEALFHADHVVMGRRLRPFTFWHAFLLDFAQSPYAGFSVPTAPEEIALAVEICARPPGVPGRRIRLPRLHPLLRWKMRGLVMPSARLRVHRQLRAYLADFNSAPRVWHRNGGRAVKSHWCLYAVSMLMRHARKTEAEAWATETGWGRHLILSLSEAGGHEVPLISDSEMRDLSEAGWEITADGELIAKAKEGNA